MSTKDRFQKRARRIQKYTTWSYSECLRLSREEITEEALAILMTLRGVRVDQEPSKDSATHNEGESK
jgi:hypothetical protein